VSALVLVPSPLQASRAIRRLCDAQGGVLLGAQVTTPEALAAATLAGVGDRRPVLPPLGERLLAWRAGLDAGGVLGGLAPGGGLAAALASALGELRRGEVAAADLRRTAAGLEGAPAERLLSLAGALEALEGRLERRALLDGPASLRAAAEVVRRGAPILESRRLDLLVVDGFHALPPGAWELVAALAARARRSRFHVPFLPELPALSAAAEPLVRRVEGLHELAVLREVELVLGVEVERAPGPAALLEAFAGGRPATVAPAPGEVALVHGEGEDGEAAAAARLAARLVERGFAPEELLVFHPAPRAAADRLRSAFRREGLPFAAGRGAPLDRQPVVRTALAALGAAAGGLDRAALERLAGSWYLPGSGRTARLDRLLDRSGAVAGRIGPEAALRRRAGALEAAHGERQALLDAADGLSRLRALVSPLGRSARPTAQAAELERFLEGAGLRRLAGAGDPEAAGRDLAALSRLAEVADGLARTLALLGEGEAPMASGAWRELLAQAVAAGSLPAGGEPAAGAVELWGLDEAPGRSARAALVLGCAPGAFPAAPSPEPLLQEPERRALNGELRRGAVATASSRRAESLHRAGCALAAGREVVAIGWPADGPGGGGPPAPQVAEALRAIRVAVPSSGAPVPLGEARVEGEALAAVARRARVGSAARAEAALELLPPALQERARSALARGAIEAERRHALRTRTATPHAGLLEGAGLAALRARLPEEWTATRLEAQAHCPFRFMLSLGAGLVDEESAGLDIDAREEGRLLHEIMERWVAGCLAQATWPPAASAAAQAEARAAAEPVLARAEREGRTGDPAVWAGRRAALLARVDRLVVAEAGFAQGVALRPALLEHHFGGGSGRPPLRLEHGGRTVLVQGRIDRVDASVERLLLIDYKTGSDARRYAELLDPEGWGLHSFQVPLYLAAAARELPGRGAAATFQLLRRAERLEPVEGLPGEALAEAVVAAAARAEAGRFPLVSRGCQRCPFGAVCRAQGVADLAGEEEAP